MHRTSYAYHISLYWVLSEGYGFIFFKAGVKFRRILFSIVLMPYNYRELLQVYKYENNNYW